MGFFVVAGVEQGIAKQLLEIWCISNFRS